MSNADYNAQPSCSPFPLVLITPAASQMPIMSPFSLSIMLPLADVAEVGVLLVSQVIYSPLRLSTASSHTHLLIRKVHFTIKTVLALPLLHRESRRDEGLLTPLVLADVVVPPPEEVEDIDADRGSTHNQAGDVPRGILGAEHLRADDVANAVDEEGGGSDERLLGAASDVDGDDRPREDEGGDLVLGR